MRYVESVEITADVDRVWAVQVDVERWPEWLPTVTSLRRLDAGPFTVGSSARLAQPRLRPAVWRVTELDPPRLFVWESDSPGVHSRGEHRVEALPEGRVRVELVMVQTGPLARPVGLLLGRTVRDYLRQEAAALKRRCEQG
ncbi:SRPBCC family protein [Micromonospora auratinigra]|uniref:Polyketide cyclase / dehydrase and lipid transport n=1 Tax=Micromonospora auratinigra TaxID=261654 RepID=A0A1A8YZI0_9ACTN|nr:SRPBCC family protein [Micromonospora auratinigra]SBT36938.1 Polyketide cyclase / dehydrase and lipid transport [Micromonospora auratinigra]